MTSLENQYGMGHHQLHRCYGEEIISACIFFNIVNFKKEKVEESTQDHLGMKNSIISHNTKTSSKVDVSRDQRVKN